MIKRIVPAILLSLVLTGCLSVPLSVNNRTNSSSRGDLTTSSSTVELMANGQASSISVAANASVALSWTSSGFTSCYLLPYGVVVPTSYSSYPVSAPTTTITYTLVCGETGTTPMSSSVTITVEGSTAPAVTLLGNGQSNFVSLVADSSLTLSWSAPSGSSCQIRDRGLGQLSHLSSSSGSNTLNNIYQSDVYDLICLYEGYTEVSTLYVNVHSQGGSGSGSFASLLINGQSGAVSIAAGQAITLTWTSSSDAESCYIWGPQSGTNSSNLGAVPASNTTPGITVSNLLASVPYTLACYTFSGVTVVSSVFVTIQGQTFAPVQVNATVTYEGGAARDTDCLYLIDASGATISIGCNKSMPYYQPVQVALSMSQYSCNTFGLYLTNNGTTTQNTTNASQVSNYMELTKSGNSLQIIMNDNYDTTNHNDTNDFNDVIFTIQFPNSNFGIQNSSVTCN